MEGALKKLLVPGLALALAAGCGPPKLTRGSSKTLVEQALTLEKPPLSLTPDGIERGKRDGLWEYGFIIRVLTPRGEELFESFVSLPLLGAWVRPREGAPQLIEVTGITDPMEWEQSGDPSHLKEVHFSWAYTGLEEEVRALVEARVEQGKALMRLYDDGWRVEELAPTAGRSLPEE